MTEKIEDIIEDEEKAEKLSEIIEKKVEEKVETITGNTEEKTEKRSQGKPSEDEGVSRRSFLKKLGAGALGLGAASLIPSTAAYDIRSTDALEVYDDTGTKYFDVQPGGPVEVKNTGLKLPTGQSIEDGNGTPRVSLNSSGTIIYSDGGTGVGNPAILLRDNYYTRIYANNDAPLEIYDDQFSGVAVEYKSSSSAPGTLELTNAELDLNNNIISDVQAVKMNNRSGAANSPELYTYTNGNIWIRTDGSGDHSWQVRDRANSDQVLQQWNEGGPVEIKNSNLDVGSNKIKTSNFEITENSSTNSLDFNYTG